MMGLRLAEAGLLPDRLVRLGIRSLLRDRVAELERGGVEAADAEQRRFRFARQLSPIAPLPELANHQHYEVAPEFFEHVQDSV